MQIAPPNFTLALGVKLILLLEMSNFQSPLLFLFNRFLLFRVFNGVISEYARLLNNYNLGLCLLSQHRQLQVLQM
jgi:hypothetical protein